jgi:signal transduction histidine kinase
LRLRSVLDLWLVVVLFAFIIELTLSVYPSPARFTAGWYGSRVYALLYSSLVLLMLLIETTKLYGRLLDAVLAQRREHQRQVAMDAMAAGMAHELKQPLAQLPTMAMQACVSSQCPTSMKYAPALKVWSAALIVPAK